jgi:two-component system cell cycle sensor histidine kinase/response regulator CckA
LFARANNETMVFGKGWGVSNDGDRAGVHPREYFRVLVEQAADGIFISSQGGLYLDVNASGHRLLGYAPGELIGKRIVDVLDPDELPRLQGAIAGLLRGEIQTQEWVMLRKDGSVLEAEVRAQLLSSGLFLGIVRDLSPGKLIERKVRASEAQLRSILQTAPDVIMTVDRAGKILFINRTLPPLSPHQVVGTCCFDYVVPEARPRIVAAVERVFATREIVEYEVQAPPDPTGERGWSSVRMGPLVEGDRVVGATLCATDVTGRYRDEARSRELSSRLQKIASQVPGMVYQFKLRPDGSTCFPYASERIREIYRVSPEEVRDNANAVLAVVHPDDFAGLVDSITLSAKTMRPWQHEYRVKFPDGEVRWLYGTSVPESQSDGSTLWHGFITDVTHRQEADRSKSALEDQLRQSQKFQSIGKLAGGVAHDFNNLLTSMIGFVELALMDVPQGSVVAEYLDSAVESARRGAALTQQLLAFARKKIVRPEVVTVNEVLEPMAPMIRRLVGENLEVVLELAPDLGPVNVDVGGLQQVIMNVVVNARDAISGTGQIRLQTANVSLDAAHCRTHAETVPGEYVMVAVSDNGAGMSAEVRSQIFEPFFTTKDVGEGSGLGLAMCHGIIKQAGGNISVDSELGKGSRFCIYLPRVEREPVSVPTSRALTSSARGSETLLLVEDEEMILRLARVALSALGYQLMTAADGVQALDLVARTSARIHLLITDVVMPRMGGRELATRLTALQPGVRVLYSSGYTGDAIVEDGVLAQGIDFLQKPYTPALLARRVREVLDKA